MARIIVTTAERERSDAHIMVNDQLRPHRVSNQQALLMERLGWTVVDAQPRSVGWRAADRRLRPPGAARG